MRSLSFLDFLCLDFLLKKFGLPLVRFVNDLGLWILEPFGKGERRLSLRRQIPEAEALEQTVGEGFSALLFLRRPPKLGTKARRGRDLEVDLIATLVGKQRVTAPPILLVPQTFVWSKQSGTASPSLLDLLFGPVQWPGRVRVFCQFLLNYRDAKLRSGEPFDLQEFLGNNPDLTDAEAANKVRYALLRRMERDRAGAGHGDIVSYLNFKHLLRIFEKDRALRMELGKYESNKWNSMTKPLGELRNEVMHPVTTLVGSVDDLLIADRAAGLHDRGGPGVGGGHEPNDTIQVPGGGY